MQPNAVILLSFGLDNLIALPECGETRKKVKTKTN